MFCQYLCFTNLQRLLSHSFLKGNLNQILYNTLKPRLCLFPSQVLRFYSHFAFILFRTSFQIPCRKQFISLHFSVPFPCQTKSFQTQIYNKKFKTNRYKKKQQVEIYLLYIDGLVTLEEVFGQNQLEITCKNLYK